MTQLNPIFLWMMISSLTTILVWMVGYMFLNSEDSTTMDSNEPFECGLDPISENRAPFRMHFFLVGILFLVFDIEIIVSLPMILAPIKLNVWLLFWVTFMSILLMGLIVEVTIGTLDWKE